MELLSSVEPRVVDWSLVTRGETGNNNNNYTTLLCVCLLIVIRILKRNEFCYWHFKTEEEMMLNATYIISVARKLGCSIFLLPEDIIEVDTHII